MKRFFKVAMATIVVLTAISCNASIEGRWEYLYTEEFEDGELDEKTKEDEGWSLWFNADGTGYEIEYHVKTPIYWKVKGGWLYYDYEPLTDLDKDYALRIVHAKSDELKLRAYYDSRKDYDDYTFRREE